MKNITLTDAEIQVLEELTAQALCGYTDKETEKILTGLESKFESLTTENKQKGGGAVMI